MPRKPYEALSQEIYARFFDQIEPLIADKKHIVICPDKMLWDLPFGALTQSEGKKKTFLAERFNISYAYSATTAYANFQHKSSEKKASLASALVLANPNFGDNSRFGDDLHIPGQRPIDLPSRPIDLPSRPIDLPSRPIDLPSRPIDLPSRPIDLPSRDLMSQLSQSKKSGKNMKIGIVALPGTQKEADAIRSLYPSSAIYTEERAQESVFKAKSGNYRYLHLASHAFFNDASPMMSSIFLAQPNQDDGEDGYLTAREIFGLDLNAELVVLSACQTGRGQQRSGEGIVGLTWALFAAGCPTQVVSQWSVDDGATSHLMSTFYKNLKQNLSKSESLQKASLAVLRGEGVPKNLAEKYRHPYYWAPFILIGDWR